MRDFKKTTSSATAFELTALGSPIVTANGRVHVGFHSARRCDEHRAVVCHVLRHVQRSGAPEACGDRGDLAFLSKRGIRNRRIVVDLTLHQGVHAPARREPGVARRADRGRRRLRKSRRGQRLPVEERGSADKLWRVSWSERRHDVRTCKVGGPQRVHGRIIIPGGTRRAEKRDVDQEIFSSVHRSVSLIHTQNVISLRNVYDVLRDRVHDLGVRQTQYGRYMLIGRRGGDGGVASAHRSRKGLVEAKKHAKRLSTQNYNCRPEL
eukprot:6104562-Pleurochrysis_carterae.AAC.3